MVVSSVVVAIMAMIPMPIVVVAMAVMAAVIAVVLLNETMILDDYHAIARLREIGAEKRCDSQCHCCNKRGFHTLLLS